MLRGTFGYISKKKKSYLQKTFLYLLIGILIFTVGYFLNKRSTSNVFTVLAILMVLPGAKAVVGYVVFYPFHSVGLDAFTKVYQLVATKVESPNAMEQVMETTVVKQDSVNLYTDVVFTSPDKVMNLDFLLLGQNRGIALMGKEKQQPSYMESYLKKGLSARNFQYGMKVYHSMEQFIKAVEGLDVKDSKNESRKEVVEYIESLIVV